MRRNADGLDLRAVSVYTTEGRPPNGNNIRDETAVCVSTCLKPAMERVREGASPFGPTGKVGWMPGGETQDYHFREGFIELVPVELIPELSGHESRQEVEGLVAQWKMMRGAGSTSVPSVQAGLAPIPDSTGKYDGPREV